jgi:hypothetical protein
MVSAGGKIESPASCDILGARNSSQVQVVKVTVAQSSSCGRTQPVAQPIVQTVRSLFPQLVELGPDPVTTPSKWARWSRILWNASASSATCCSSTARLAIASL